MNYRNPKIEALEQEVKRLKYQLDVIKRFGNNYISSTAVEPANGMVFKDDVTFFRVATMTSTYSDYTYHFLARILTPPNQLSMSYYLNKEIVEDSASAYDVLTCVTENFMNEFYKQLKRKI